MRALHVLGAVFVLSVVVAPRTADGLLSKVKIHHKHRLIETRTAEQTRLEPLTTMAMLAFVTAGSAFVSNMCKWADMSAHMTVDLGNERAHKAFEGLQETQTWVHNVLQSITKETDFAPIVKQTFDRYRLPASDAAGADHWSAADKEIADADWEELYHHAAGAVGKKVASGLASKIGFKVGGHIIADVYNPLVGHIVAKTGSAFVSVGLAFQASASAISNLRSSHARFSVDAYADEVTGIMDRTKANLLRKTCAYIAATFDSYQTALDSVSDQLKTGRDAGQPINDNFTFVQRQSLQEFFRHMTQQLEGAWQCKCATVQDMSVDTVPANENTTIVNLELSRGVPEDIRKAQWTTAYEVNPNSLNGLLPTNAIDHASNTPQPWNNNQPFSMWLRPVTAFQYKTEQGKEFDGVPITDIAVAFRECSENKNKTQMEEVLESFGYTLVVPVSKSPQVNDNAPCHYVPGDINLGRDASYKGVFIYVLREPDAPALMSIRTIWGTTQPAADEYKVPIDLNYAPSLSRTLLGMNNYDPHLCLRYKKSITAACPTSPAATRFCHQPRNDVAFCEWTAWPYTGAVYTDGFKRGCNEKMTVIDKTYGSSTFTDFCSPEANKLYTPSSATPSPEAISKRDEKRKVWTVGCRMGMFTRANNSVAGQCGRPVAPLDQADVDIVVDYGKKAPEDFRF